MSAVEFAGFEMVTSRAPVVIQGLEFVSAEGDYAAPDSSRGILTMKASGLTVELATVSIGDRTWLTNPLTGAWEELPSGTGFNPAIVFGPEGWVPLLTSDLSEAVISGVEDGEYVVTGTVASPRVEVLTAGVASDQNVDIVLHLDTTTRHITHAEFSTVDEAGTTDWVIDLFDFGEEVDIEAPAP